MRGCMVWISDSRSAEDGTGGNMKGRFGARYAGIVSGGMSTKRWYEDYCSKYFKDQDGLLVHLMGRLSRKR